MENQMASLSTDPAFDLAADWQPKHYVALQPMAANRRKPAPAGRVDGYINPAAPTELLTKQEFIGVETAAKIVDLHTKVIRRAIDDGELTAYKLGSRIRIRRVDFDAWIEANRVVPYPVPEIDPT
jgi:excisionase family DNA binding protein